MKSESIFVGLKRKREEIKKKLPKLKVLYNESSEEDEPEFIKWAKLKESEE